MLKRAKRALAGTYFAEQVATASYDLVCASHVEKMSRPGTQSSVVANVSSNIGSKDGGNYVPGSARGRRRRNVSNQDGRKCTKLPALENIDPLLEPGDDILAAAVVAATPTCTSHDANKELQEKRLRHVTRAAARLCRGEGPPPVRHRHGEIGCGTPTDVEVLAALTQPLAQFSNPISGTLKGSKGGKHQTYQDAVQAGLAGTEMGARPRRKPVHSFFKRRALHQREDNTMSTSTLRSFSTVRSLETTKVQIVPEDPVQALLNTDIVGHGGNKTLPDAEQGADSAAELRDGRRASGLRRGLNTDPGTLEQEVRKLKKRANPREAMATQDEKKEHVEQSVTKNKECTVTSWRVPTPNTLANDELEALVAVFNSVDLDGSGSVTIEELILSGLVDKESAPKYMPKGDGPDAKGQLSVMSFCELFCPTGYKAHSKAKIGSDETGRRLVFDDRLSGWRLEDTDQAYVVD